MYFSIIGVLTAIVGLNAILLVHGLPWIFVADVLMLECCGTGLLFYPFWSARKHVLAAKNGSKEVSNTEIKEYFKAIDQKEHNSDFWLMLITFGFSCIVIPCFLSCGLL